MTTALSNELPKVELEDWTEARIDRQSPVPYYYQLQEILKQELEDGRWPPGALLPSEAELASAFGISRTVIRQALRVLEDDGQVFTVKGKGTVVAPAKFRYEAVSAARQWLNTDAASAVMLWRLIHVAGVSAGGHFSRLLRVAPTAELAEIIFVSALAGKPVSLSQMYLRKDASPALAERDCTRSSLGLVEGAPDPLRQIGARFGVTTAESEITVESTVANQFEAAELSIRRNTPLLLLSVLSTGADRRPLAFTRTVVRSDSFRFNVVIKHYDTEPGHGSQPQFLAGT